MKTVNWIFGSAIFLLLLIILFELMSSKTFKVWVTKFKAQNEATIQLNQSRKAYVSGNSHTRIVADSTKLDASNIRNELPVKQYSQPAPVKQYSQPVNSIQNNLYKPIKATTSEKKRDHQNRKIIANNSPVSDANLIVDNAIVQPAVTMGSGYNNPYQSKSSQAVIEQAINNQSDTYKSNKNIQSVEIQSSKNPIQASGYLSRKITQSEMDEFIRQFPDRSLNIQFVNFGSIDAEMENVKAQITYELSRYKYRDINKGWNQMAGYVSTDDVHFAANGPRGVIVYIPPIRNNP